MLYKIMTVAINTVLVVCVACCLELLTSSSLLSTIKDELILTPSSTIDAGGVS